MDRKLERNKLFANIERDIANLQTKLENDKMRKKKLEQLVSHHLMELYPEKYNRVFKELPLLSPEQKYIEKMFVNQGSLCKDILGYSFKVTNFCYEEVNNTLCQIWEIEGQLADHSFLVKFLSEENEADILNSIGNERTESCVIQNLEIFPQSEVFIELAAKLKELNLLTSIIPCLYMFQKFHKERNIVQEKLSPYKEVNMSEENGSLLINLVNDSLLVRIEWDIAYRYRGHNFFNAIAVHANESEVEAKFRNHSCLSVLKGEDQLMFADDVLKFVENFFQD